MGGRPDQKQPLGVGKDIGPRRTGLHGGRALPIFVMSRPSAVLRSKTMDTKRFAVTHTDAEWRRLLTPEQYEIMRRIDAITLLGARIIADGLDDPGVQSMTLADPFGNEFEVSRVHD